MKILIVGSGAREHAIGNSIAKNSKVSKIYFAPGNAGTLNLGENLDIKAMDIDGLLKFAVDNKIDYTIVGPEDPLCAGIGDAFEGAGLKIFAPLKEAAILEGSKAYSKDFCIRHNLKTAKYLETTKYEEAISFAEKLLNESGRVVLKADGLCAGKGVVIAGDMETVKDFCKEVLEGTKYGKNLIVVEEFLEGFEMSLLCFVDGKNIIPLPTSRDHKKIFDGENGPNTGGMGTYSPNSSADIYEKEIEEEILKPFMEGLKKDNIDYRGLVFIGLMIGDKGINVLEFNVRFGDPETQSILQRLESDLLETMMLTSEGKLSTTNLKFNNKKVITVVLASEGYPGDYEKGKEIIGLDSVKESRVFHAGTALENGKVVTNGGRVLSVTAVADTFEEAFEKAYSDVSKINFKGMQYRKDIGPMVKRVYVEKKTGFDNEAQDLKENLIQSLNVKLDNVRVFSRYDIENMEDKDLEDIYFTILAEKPVDNLYAGNDALDLQKSLVNPLVVEYHPGQFDQRKQGLLDTIAVAKSNSDVEAKCAKVYEFTGDLNADDLKKIEEYLINPVDQQKGQLLEIPTTLIQSFKSNLKNEVYNGFINFTKDELKNFLADHGLSMSIEDLEFIQNYFKSEKRDPNETEISILDTYWSDHCRHTTFNTTLDIEFMENLQGLDKIVKDSFEEYLNSRKEINRTKDVNLMDLATIVARYLTAKGNLEDVEVSEEVNACSIRVKANIKNENTGEINSEDYLVMFKNETHNHPTEIEPFGGASTCLGGAIRDPLSGRSYVYQAMRVTGSGNVLESVEETLKGKLPQKKITTEAARGYSSYGNQIGLTTGLVDEIYHDGYKAKRMEVGAVVGAAPEENVKRIEPTQGDVILLVGGDTGRDGVGGATGSSKEHSVSSIEESSAEVQKGNAPTERKIQRLFRNPNAAKLIKKCNDFGAGGVSVAIGELADSLEINLEKVPLKYMGLTPREIAISESQERMAIVVASKDKEEFLKYCHEENLQGVQVAQVTNSGRMIIKYEDMVIADLEREFLNSAGAPRFQKVIVEAEGKVNFFDKYSDLKVKDLEERLSCLNVASKKNLIEKFDSTVGKATVLTPLGGKNQITPIQSMVCAIPSLKGKSLTASVMAYGFNPYLSEESQYLGGYYAVIESLSKIAATGANPLKARLSFQEYFEKLGEDEKIWSKPLKSLLGAFAVTKELGIPPIGGKDSMSGTFEDIHVPPTLISFALTTEEVENIISPELKGEKLLGLIETKRDENNLLDLNEFVANLKVLRDEIIKGNIVSAYAITHKGTLPMLFEMAIGNDIGFNVELQDLYSGKYGSFIVEYKNEVDSIKKIGESTGESLVVNGKELDKNLVNAYKNPLSTVFAGEKEYESPVKLNSTDIIKRKTKSDKPVENPKVILTVFPGTNCEYDMARAFEKEGAKAEIFVFNNLNNEEINKSIELLAEKIKSAQILAIPGGFSLGDEPDGSGKFIANVLRNPKIAQAIQVLLEENDGLIIGICNGFQALIKTGLLPFGKICEIKEDMPTLTYNSNGTHIARMVRTKALTKDSPWLSQVEFDKEYIIPISHGEGRFVCDENTFNELLENNQIATTYVDNPNGSYYDIEGIISKDGKIIGKMGHSERFEEGLHKNIPNMELQPVIRGGVNYFKEEK